ncbi:hypothetical protein Ddep01_03481 [Deinococcus depolymerans]
MPTGALEPRTDVVRPSPAIAAASVTVRPSVPPVPTVRAVQVSQLPIPLVEDVLAGLQLSSGARRTFEALHDLALHALAVRGHSPCPNTLTLHLPQQLLAEQVGYTTRHLRRLLTELVTAGVLDWGAHASKVRGMSLWDGCLWAVKLRPAQVVPQLRREDWLYDWRDFEGDMAAGRTVKGIKAEMSQLHPDERKKAVIDTLKAWAVIPGTPLNPVACSSDIGATDDLDVVQGVTDVVRRLDEVAQVHPSHRAGLVGRLGSALSKALGDRQSRRFYCGLIWQSWREEIEGHGGLQVLKALLERLQVDRREWLELRSPGALLAARWNARTA